MFKETVTCVCDRVARFNDCVSVSRYLDKWDLRTHEVRYYCRSCAAGKSEALTWLRKKYEPEDHTKD